MTDRVEVRDENPWYLPRSWDSQYLQVSCNNAYLLVRKSDGLTEIGYKDEGDDVLPLATDTEIASWLAIFQWRAEQVPWQEQYTKEHRLVWCADCGHSPARHMVDGCFQCDCLVFQSGGDDD